MKLAMSSRKVVIVIDTTVGVFLKISRSLVTRSDFVTMRRGKPCFARASAHLRVILYSLSNGWYGSVQSLIMTGSFSFVFLVMFSIWSSIFWRGLGGPLKLGNLGA